MASNENVTHRNFSKKMETNQFRYVVLMVKFAGGKKSLLSVAIIDEFYFFDLMEIHAAKLSLNLKVKIFCIALYCTHHEDEMVLLKNGKKVS